MYVLSIEQHLDSWYPITVSSWTWFLEFFVQQSQKFIVRDVEPRITDYRIENKYKWYISGMISWDTYVYDNMGLTVTLINSLTLLNIWIKCIGWSPKCMNVLKLGSKLNTREDFKWRFYIFEPWIGIENFIICSNGMGPLICLNKFCP